MYIINNIIKMSIGQIKTDDYIPLKRFTARPYPNTRVSIKFINGRIKEG